MNLTLLAIAIIVGVLGVVLPEVRKRRQRLGVSREVPDIIVAIERLRSDLVNTMWQVEATFFALLLGALSFFL